MNARRKAESKGNRKREGDNYYGIYFLSSVIVLYFVLYLITPESIQNALKASGDLLIQIAFLLVLIVLFMGILNYVVNPKTVSKYVGKGSGIKGWALAISTGVLSHGPIYLWYPLLKELRNQGMRSGLIAVFLYNRAIKIPLLPLMIYYFGTLFVLVLLIYIILASLIEGKIIEIIEQ